jgi:hypothetical protein
VLKALNNNGLFVIGPDAARGETYTCPACHEELIFKCGRRVVPHFAHRPDSSCVLSDGESVRHMEMKLLCRRLFAADGVELEVPLIPDRRADVVVAGRTVVECQASPMSEAEWSGRTEDYNRLGYPVLWIWDVARVCGVKTVAEAWRLAAGRNWEARIPAVVRLCHKASYGHLYCADADELVACHLGQAAERVHASDGDWPDRHYTPRTLRCPEFRRVNSADKWAFLGPSRLMLVNFSEGDWWND